MPVGDFEFTPGQNSNHHSRDSSSAMKTQPSTGHSTPVPSRMTIGVGVGAGVGAGAEDDPPNAVHHHLLHLVAREKGRGKGEGSDYFQQAC